MSEKVSQLSMDELKVKIKAWEKKFAIENHEKPGKVSVEMA